MNMMKQNDFQEQESTEEDTSFNMINDLSHLCDLAEAAKLELVSLHLNIALEELKNHLMIHSIHESDRIN